MLVSSLVAGDADQRLVDLLKNKSPDAFGQLYDQYAGALYGFICRVVSNTGQAEALLQDVFVRIWKEIDGYEPTKERLFTWMFRLTLQACGPTKETIKALNL